MAATEIGDRARIEKRQANRGRLGKNQSSATAQSYERVAFTCECADARCDETVWMVESHFWQVVRAAGVSLVAPGHSSEDEDIIAACDAYLLVRNHGR